MVLFIMIGRVIDGLPLCASVQTDEESSRGILDYQNQAKSLLKKMTDRSPARCSIETGPYVFHYIIENSVCFMTLCEKNFSKRMAYSFLEDVANEFDQEYGASVSTATRPYSFIEFDTYIQKAKRNYQDSRARRNLTKLNDELQDVQKIMVQNIDDVLQRGELLSVLDDKAGQLKFQSEKYKKDAKYLNLRSKYAKIAALGIITTIILIYIRFWWLV